MKDTDWLTLVRQTIAQQQQQQLGESSHGVAGLAAGVDATSVTTTSAVGVTGAAHTDRRAPSDSAGGTAVAAISTGAIPRNAASALALLNEQAVPESQDVIMQYANQPSTTVLAGTWAIVLEYNRAHVAACVVENGRVRIWALHHRSGSGAANPGGRPKRARGQGRAAAVGGAMVDGQGPAHDGGRDSDDEDDAVAYIELDEAGGDMADRMARIADDPQGRTRENAMSLSEHERRRLLDYAREYGTSGSGTSGRSGGKEAKSQNKTLPALLELSVGCRVMVLANLATPLGIVNGAPGTVWGFRYGGVNVPDEAERDADADAAARTMPRQPIVLVQLDVFAGTSFVPGVPRIVPISPTPTSIHVGRSSYVRTQLPLCVAKASTIHKAQGQSLESVCVDVRRFFKPGMAYVSISRAKWFRRLWILHGYLEVKSFQKVPPAIMAEYARLRALCVAGSAAVAASVGGASAASVSAASLVPAPGPGLVGVGDSGDGGAQLLMVQQQPQPQQPQPQQQQQQQQQQADAVQPSAIADLFHAPMGTVVPASMLLQRRAATATASRAVTGSCRMSTRVRSCGLIKLLCSRDV